MSKALTAADDVRKLTKMFQSLGTVVEILDRVGSAEQAENEAKARVEKLNAEAEQAKAAIAEAKAAAEKVVADATAKADELDKEGKDDLAKAKKKASEHLAEAIEKVEKIISESQATVTRNDELASEAIAKRDAAEKELADLEKKIEDARKRIAKLLDA